MAGNYFTGTLMGKGIPGDLEINIR